MPNKPLKLIERVRAIIFVAASAARKHVLGFFSHAGRPVVMNISTIPQWMFKADKPVSYPSDPDEITWSYEQGPNCAILQ